MVTTGSSEIFVATNKGKSIRFDENDVRAMGRLAHGVRAINLADDDYVVGCTDVQEGDKLLLVTENGLGKVTPIEEYKVQTRGGKGVKTYKITEKTGAIIGVARINPEEDVMMITSSGTIIRTAISGIKEMGRATQGVILMKTAKDEKLVSIATAEHEEEAEAPEGTEIVETVEETTEE